MKGREGVKLDIMTVHVYGYNSRVNICKVMRGREGGEGEVCVLKFPNPIGSHYLIDVDEPVII
jgi:hypothetical protein